MSLNNKGQSLTGIIILLIVASLIGGSLYYYLSKQIPGVSEIARKPIEEVVTPPSKEELPTEKEETPPEEKLEEKPTETSCQNECSLIGSKKCSNNGYQICGNYDTDNCLEWSSIINCPLNTICQNGNCVQLKCTDGTPYGQCSPNKPKYCDNGNLIEKASLCGCPLGYEILDNHCIKEGKKIVVLVIDEYLHKDGEIKSRIERYKKDNREYEFVEIVFNKTNKDITSMKDVGGNIKHNSLELRNTIKQLYRASNKRVIGVWLIGNIRPTIWRDANLWRDLGKSGFYPSIYPLIALDKDYYIDFDVKNDGFYEKEGATRGSEIGGGYNATIWGAVLIPPTFDKKLGKELIKNYFDRNHNYRTSLLKYDKKLLYSDVFGCSTEMIQKIKNTQKWEAIFLCPNVHEKLKGFNSLYHVNIYSHHPGGSIVPITNEEQKEFETWMSRDYFGNSRLTKMGGLVLDYEFLLHLKGRSLSVEEIKNKLENNLPQKICNRIGNCKVGVNEFRFEEEDGTWDGYWKSYPIQRSNWKLLYNDMLNQNNFEITYLSAHGSPTFHDFNITSEIVRSNNYSSMIYEIQSCNTGNYLVNNYLAGTYLFYGNALVVSAYSIPVIVQGEWGYAGEEYVRFLKIQKETPVIEGLFLWNYGNYLYFGDPLLKLK